MKFVFGQLLLVPLLFVLLVGPTRVFAAVRCDTQYGGGETCVRTGQLQIDKKVWDPDSSSFVDNLGLTSHRFISGNEVTFDLKVTNTGDARIDSIVVNDTLPSFLVPSGGGYSYTISGLDAGASDERQIKAKVVDASKLPSDKTIVCDVNSAETHSGDFSDRDTAQVCVENKVLGTTTIPVKQLPATGPEDWFLLAAIPMMVFFGKKLTEAR